MNQMPSLEFRRRLIWMIFGIEAMGYKVFIRNINLYKTKTSIQLLTPCFLVINRDNDQFMKNHNWSSRRK